MAAPMATDGAATDGPGCKGRMGDELEDEPGSFTDDESDDGMDENAAVTPDAVATMNEAAGAFFVHAIKAVVGPMLDPTLKAPDVPAPIAAIVVDMLTATMQDGADRFKENLAAARVRERERAHKREQSRLRMEKSRARRKRDAVGASQGVGN